MNKKSWLKVAAGLSFLWQFVRLDLYSCMGRRAVGHRCRDWFRQWCAVLAATSPAAVGLIL